MGYCPHHIQQYFHYYARQSQVVVTSPVVMDYSVILWVLNYSGNCQVADCSGITGDSRYILYNLRFNVKCMTSIRLNGYSFLPH